MYAVQQFSRLALLLLAAGPVLTAGLAGIGRPAIAAPFTIQELVDRIQAKNATTIEEALPLLPEDLRRSYTLVFDSHALQSSTYAAPRAILFGDDARFIVSFGAGRASDPAFESLEILQYDDSARAFSLYNLVFPPKLDSQGKVALPPKNPELCLKCHMSDPKPVWGTFNHWRNLYGSKGDLPEGEELKQFRALTAAFPTHPRFKWLARDPSRPNFPYATSAGSSLEERPNLRLTLLLGRMAAQRLRRKIETAPLKDTYFWLRYYSSVCREPLDSPQGDAWTKDDIAALRSRVEADVISAYGEHGRFDDAFNTVPAWHPLNLLGLRPADYNLSTSDPDSEDLPHTAWFDGSGTPGDFLMYDDLLLATRELPELEGWEKVVTTGQALTDFQGPAYVQTDADRAFIASLDALAGPYAIGRQKSSPSCPKILEKVRQEIGRP